MTVKKETKPWQALTAGTFAGAVEAFVTYPTEFVKTRSQFDGNKDGPLAIVRDTWNKHGLKGFYSGCTALVVGNAVKAGVRFVSYDKFKQMLADENMMRQGANSAVRFTTYSTLKQFVQSNMRLHEGSSLPSSITFGVGAVAGLVTVYTTMPLDVVKTRMQSLKARSQYKNSFDCAYQTFTNDGILSFWRGTTPRLARLMLSGGIVFTVYEKVIVLLGGKEVA
ncbi:hypothetical protein FRC06_002344 [Ceratobasidium sp. 370]|nr:hypothetical protein FRC06_002344 [Ceratobasidium sp. 370]